MEVVKQEDQIFLKHKGKFYGYYHCCHKFGHKVVDCRTKGKDQTLRRKQEINKEDDKGKVSRIPHGRISRNNSDYENSEETQISNISEVSKDDDEHNSAINKNEDEGEGDEEVYSDDCGILF